MRGSSIGASADDMVGYPPGVGHDRQCRVGAGSGREGPPSTTKRLSTSWLGNNYSAPRLPGRCPSGSCRAGVSSCPSPAPCRPLDLRGAGRLEDVGVPVDQEPAHLRSFSWVISVILATGRSQASETSSSSSTLLSCCGMSCTTIDTAMLWLKNSRPSSWRPRPRAADRAGPS